MSCPKTVSGRMTLTGFLLVAIVATVGASGVLKVRSPPKLVPARLVATRRKWYRVLPSSPAMLTLAGTRLFPEPASCAIVRRPYFLVRPYWKYQVVTWPFGFTAPLRVAPWGVTAVALSVRATGF